MCEADHGSADFRPAPRCRSCVAGGLNSARVARSFCFDRRLPTALGGAPLPAVRNEEVTDTRRLILSVEQPEFPPAANYQELAYLICGQRFDPDRIDQRIR